MTNDQFFSANSIYQKIRDKKLLIKAIVEDVEREKSRSYNSGEVYVCGKKHRIDDVEDILLLLKLRCEKQIEVLEEQIKLI